MRIRSRYRNVAALVLVWAFIVGFFVGPQQPAQSFDLNFPLIDLIKIFGIGWVVNRFADDIDGTINDVLRQKDAEIAGATKVVPILRVGGGGGGTAVGAAQVMGPSVQVDKVQAVAELEINIGDVRGRALVPVSTKSNLTSSVKGIGGVGVSANVKFNI